MTSNELTKIIKEIHMNFKSLETSLKSNNIKIMDFIEDLLSYNYPRYSKYSFGAYQFSEAYKTLYQPILDQLPLDSMVLIEDSSSYIKNLEESSKELCIIFLVPVVFIRAIYTISIDKYLKIEGNIIDDCEKFIDILYMEISKYLTNAFMNYQLDRSSRSYDLLWDDYKIAFLSVLQYYLRKNKLFLDSYLSEELKLIRYEAVNH